MLEAGPTDNNPLIKIPSAFYWNYDSSIDWKYNSEPNNRHKVYQISNHILFKFYLIKFISIKICLIKIFILNDIS